MPIPTWTPGEVLLSADVNTWFVPLAAVKSGDQSVTSSTALVSDSDLQVACAANSTYALIASVLYEGGTQGSSDLKWQFAAISGGTVSSSVTYIDTGGNTHFTEVAGGSAVAAGSNGAGVSLRLAIMGVVVTTTAQTLIFQWAQNSSSGTATKVKTNSWIQLQRVA